MVKERPVLFSGPMVRAILDGRKTMTRRILNPQPHEDYSSLCGPLYYEPTIIGRNGEEREGPKVFGVYTEDGEWGVKCPFEPGMRLWVRETWLQLDRDHWWDSEQPFDYRYYTGTKQGYRRNSVAYRASTDSEGDEIRAEYGYKWKPSIFMPRWASRITLEITDVRVQRIQDISEADAQAEGVTLKPIDCRPGYEYREHFEDLWDAINGKTHPWSANEWVWAITFKRLEATP